ncbi:MAG: chemotaxis protein CheA [bacterium]|nr:chemotaxis protein CheA [bacterium]
MKKKEKDKTMGDKKKKDVDWDLVLQGDLTFKNISNVRKKLVKALTSRKKKIIVKFDALEDIDFFGIQLFCAAHKTALVKNKSLIFYPPSNNNLLVKGVRQAGFPFTTDMEQEGAAIIIKSDRDSELEFRKQFKHVVSYLGSVLPQLYQPDSAEKDTMKKIYRALHTLTETEQIFGGSEMDLTAQLEKAFLQVLEGTPKNVKRFPELLLAGKNFLEKVAMGEVNETTRSEKENIILSLAKFTADAGGLGENVFTYIIRLTPVQNIRKEREIELIPLLQDLKQFGLCIIRADISNVPIIEEIDPHCCWVNWEIFLTSSHDENTIRDVFIFFSRDEVQIEKREQANRKLGQILVDDGIIKEDQLKNALEKQQGEPAESKAITTHSVRVPAVKIDHLIQQVGELITLKAQFSQLALIENLPRLNSLCEKMERLSGAMRESTMAIRLVPIGALFGKFRRVVRDLSNSLKKDIQLITEGEETELDKTVIERLDGPLVHIIRNSADHGIELPEIREKTAKKKCGTIYLHAFQAGSQVVIEVSDDGAGLNTEKIMEKAIARGVITETPEITDREIFNLIFAPGFSTVENVSDISGRGVGMDVVKRNIETLGGTVEITSKKGKGTTLTLKLPLTLAIIEGLLVRVENQYFIIPLPMIDTCLETKPDQVSQDHEWLELDEKVIPYLSLRKRFNIDGIPAKSGRAVIVNLRNKKVGFLVDQVIGQHQTVIKPLGFLGDIPGLAGATILGDGNVALILDVPNLLAKRV